MEITIYRNYLKLEVDTETRKAGFFQVNPENQEALNEAQIGNEFSDEKYFNRKCEQGVASLLELLHRFVTKCNNDAPNSATGNNQDAEHKTWVLTLSFDGRRSITASSLAELCHKYIVYNMLYSWAVMAYPKLVNEYKEQRAATALEIQRMVYRKEPPTLS